MATGRPLSECLPRRRAAVEADRSVGVDAVDVVRRQATPAGDHQALPGRVGGEHAAEVEAEQRSRGVRDQVQDVLEVCCRRRRGAQRRAAHSARSAAPRPAVGRESTVATPPAIATASVRETHALRENNVSADIEAGLRCDDTHIHDPDSHRHHRRRSRGRTAQHHQPRHRRRHRHRRRAGRRRRRRGRRLGARGLRRRRRGRPWSAASGPGCCCASPTRSRPTRSGSTRSRPSTTVGRSPRPAPSCRGCRSGSATTPACSPPSVRPCCPATART